ncbi:MAG: hypothetical protein RLP02_08310 [Coleofasciculus sp. C2-GNP5-27]
MGWEVPDVAWYVSTILVGAGLVTYGFKETIVVKPAPERRTMARLYSSHT